MGIPQYFYVITKQYRTILSSVPAKACDHLFLDYNGIIHQATRAALALSPPPAAPPTNAVIFAHIWAYTERVVGLVSSKPDTKVYIMVDGIAPKAKMQQQRKRRYLSTLLHASAPASAPAPSEATAFEQPAFDQSAPAFDQSAPAFDQSAPAFDTNAISPGTAFMTKLHTFLKEKAAARKWFLSGADEPGEGEHKMFDKMTEVPADETVFVYGLDADLIMLSLLSSRPNIFLMREQQVGNDFQYLEVDRLREGILGSAPDIESYIVLCFLLGNDFLPNISSLNLRGGGIDVLLAALKTIGIPLINPDKSISIDCLGRLLHEVARQEDDRIWQLNEEYLKRRAPEATQHFFPLLPENKHPLAQEIYRCPNANGWRQLYYKHLFPDSSSNDSKIVLASCDLYFKGILWVYNYYNRWSKDDDWFYPYGYAPTLQDLSNFVASLPPLPAQPALPPPSQQGTKVTNRFVDNRVQLLSILPIASNALLPATCRKFQTDPKYGAAHLYPKTFKLQTYLKGALHECNPILPYLDFALLERALGL